MFIRYYREDWPFISVYSGMNKCKYYMRQYVSLYNAVFSARTIFFHAAWLFRVLREPKRSREIITIMSRLTLI